jgi:hypothetical protein
MLKKIHVAGTLEDCRALINQIIVALSAEEPLDVSSSTELLFYLERVNSALKRSVSRPRERGETKTSPAIIGGADGPAPANPSPC